MIRVKIEKRQIACETEKELCIRLEGNRRVWLYKSDIKNNEWRQTWELEIDEHVWDSVMTSPAGMPV